MAHAHIDRARRLRQSSGLVETRIWALLRGSRLDGWKFRRQHPLGGYVVDFACERLRLAIEIDGGVHLLDAVALRDAERQKKIEALGWTVLRFTNEEALHRPERLMDAVRAHAAALA